MLILRPRQMDSYLFHIFFLQITHCEQESKRILFVLVGFKDIQQCSCLHVTVLICTYFIRCPHQMRNLAAWNNFWLTGLMLRERVWGFKKVRSNCLDVSPCSLAKFLSYRLKCSWPIKLESFLKCNIL